jgi:hypothetical protein
MAHDPRRASLRAHVEAIGRRSAGETDRLISALLGRWWPGGAHDRMEPAAAQWVRRWRPATGGTLPPACGCAHGVCGVCN